MSLARRPFAAAARLLTTSSSASRPMVAYRSGAAIAFTRLDDSNLEYFDIYTIKRPLIITPSLNPALIEALEKQFPLESGVSLFALTPSKLSSLVLDSADAIDPFSVGKHTHTISDREGVIASRLAISTLARPSKTSLFSAFIAPGMQRTVSTPILIDPNQSVAPREIEQHVRQLHELSLSAMERSHPGGP